MFVQIEQAPVNARSLNRIPTLKVRKGKKFQRPEELSILLWCLNDRWYQQESFLVQLPHECSPISPKTHDEMEKESNKH